MYTDMKNKRILTMSGVSIKDEFEVAREIVMGSDPISKSPKSDATDSYKFIYGDDISFDIDTYEEPLPINYEENDEDIARLFALLENSPRFNNTEEEIKRIGDEYDFFSKSNNIGFLLKVHTLIQRFKEDNIVWGVGRGSGSSSYVLYLLEVHDINPLIFDIPFHELSKEFKSKYE